MTIARATEFLHALSCRPRDTSCVVPIQMQSIRFAVRRSIIMMLARLARSVDDRCKSESRKSILTWQSVFSHKRAYIVRTRRSGAYRCRNASGALLPAEGARSPESWAKKRKSANATDEKAQFTVDAKRSDRGIFGKEVRHSRDIPAGKSYGD